MTGVQTCALPILLAEAQKYIGYPYVWGGSSPATSFDCSGYVSWVINHSGWNVGRLGAQGLYNICTPTSSPKPGDLVFFKGTYDTPGVSHCGIYVGDGKMLLSLFIGTGIGPAKAKTVSAAQTKYWIKVNKQANVATVYKLTKGKYKPIKAFLVS